jgi:hypothetical protein
MTRSHATVSVSLILVALMAPAGASTAAPVVAEQLDRSAPLPAAAKARGAAIEQVWRWTDDGGKTSNLAVFSRTDRRGSEAIVGRKLFVQLFRGAPGALAQVRLVQDGLDGCDFDAHVGFLPGSVTVTDEDEDGTAELTFGYDMTCATDVSPLARKLLVLEGAAKHILRGSSRVDIGDGVVEGGEFKAAGFQGQPALLRFAEKRWKQLLVVTLPSD